MMNTPNNPKIKEKFPNLIKVSVKILKSILLPGITNKTECLFTTSIHTTCPNGRPGVKLGRK